MSFEEDNFPKDLDGAAAGGRGRFGEDSSTLYLMFTLFLLLLHQLHLKSSGFRSRRLETPAPDHIGTLVSEGNGDPVEGFEQRNDRALTHFRGKAVLSVFCRRAAMHSGSLAGRLRCDLGMRWRPRPGRSLMRSDPGYTLNTETG